MSFLSAIALGSVVRGYGSSRSTLGEPIVHQDTWMAAESVWNDVVAGLQADGPRNAARTIDTWLDHVAYHLDVACDGASKEATQPLRARIAAMRSELNAWDDASDSAWQAGKQSLSDAAHHLRRDLNALGD